MSDKKCHRCVKLLGDIPSPPTVAPANGRHENPEIRSRMKNISEILGKGEDINATPPPPSAKKPAESKRKKVTPRKASTSTRKRRKTSGEKTEGGPSSGRVSPDTASSNVGQAEVAAPNEKKTKEKPKPKRKYNKKKVNENTKLKKNKKLNENTKLKQGEATPTNKPGQFIGLYVCKEFDGEKTLGTVVSYEAEKKLYQIGYDNLKTEYIKHDEVLKIKATGKDISEVRRLQQLGLPSKIPIMDLADY